jgi:hypothetical protein
MVRGFASGSTTTQRMQKGWMDFGPMKWLNNPVTKLYQEESSILRKEVSKFAKPVISLKDAEGKPIVWKHTTAVEFKRTRNAPFIEKKRKVEQAFAKAKEQGFRGSEDDFIEAVSNHYFDAIDKQNRELHAFIDGEMNKWEVDNDITTKRAELEAEYIKKNGEPKTDADIELMNRRIESEINSLRKEYINERINEFYDKYDFNKAFDDPVLREAALAYKEYFNNHLKVGQELGIKGLSEAHPNKLYAPQILDYDMIDISAANKAELVEAVFEGLRRNPLYRNESDTTLRSMAIHYADRAQDVSFRQSFTHGSYIAPPAESRVNFKRYHFDTAPVRKFFKTNLEELTAGYQNQMAGRQALTFAIGKDISAPVERGGIVLSGIQDYVRSIKDAIVESGEAVTQEALEEFEKMLLDIGGQLRLNPLANTPAWQATHLATAFNTARMGSGFGVLQAVELVSSSIMAGIGNVIRSGRFGDAVKSATRLMYSGTKEGDEFAKFMMNTGYLGDTLEISRANRFADGVAVEFRDRGRGWMSWVGEKLDKWNQLQFKYNGLRVIKAINEDMIGAAVHQQVIDAGKVLAKKGKLPDIEVRRLADMGISLEELPTLAREFEEKGLKGVLEMSQEAQDKLQLAIIRGVEQTLVQADSIYIPNWLKMPSKAKDILFQFQKFPVLAHNIYLRKGLADEQARTFGSILAAATTYATYRYLREQAAIAVGAMDERETKYDIFDPIDGEKNLKRAIFTGLMYSPNLGMLMNGVEYTGKALGLDLQQTGYKGSSSLQEIVGGPTVGTAQTVLDLAHYMVDDRHLTDERAMLKAKSLMVPSIPILNEALTDYIKHNY